MRERADDLRLRWAEAEELAVEKQRVELAKRQLDADANRSLETQTVLLETARRLLREQGERSDAVEDKSEEQIREMDAKLMAKLATVRGPSDRGGSQTWAVTWPTADGNYGVTCCHP